MDTWRADFFDSLDDEMPSRSELIEATNENEAADRAAAKMGGTSRVDITRTIVKKTI